MRPGRIAVAFFRASALAASLAGFAGCAILSPAGTIRVDVEVYKGPLSREPAVQFAELLAIWREFNNSIDLYQQAVCAAFVAQVIATRTGDRRVKERASIAEVRGCQGMHAGSQEVGQSPLLTASSATTEPQSMPTTPPSQSNPAPSPSNVAHEGTATVVQIKESSSPIPRSSTGAPQPKSMPATPPSAGERLLQSKCLEYYGDEASSLHKAEASACFYLAQIHLDTQHLFKSLDAIKKQEPTEEKVRLFRTSAGSEGKTELEPELRQFLLSVSSAAMQARTKAYFWAHGQVSFPVHDRTTRAVVNNFSNLASEYGNQLSARADALLKQFSGMDARYQYPDYFPQNIYLRDSQPTDFLNLYVWNRAVAPAIWEDMVLHPVESFSSEETANRVRMFERLYADNYWSRINTVSAVGTGEFRIALVKDDIGNWNLKSFDSDPSELLQAYKNASLALIQKAVELAQQAANPAGGVSGLLGMANQLALGGAPASPAGASTEANAQVTVLRRQAMERMRAVYKNAKAKTGPEDLAAATAEWKTILGEHARLVSALSEAALSKGSDPATAPRTPDAAATVPLKPGAEPMPVPKVFRP